VKEIKKRKYESSKLEVEISGTKLEKRESKTKQKTQFPSQRPDGKKERTQDFESRIEH